MKTIGCQVLILAALSGLGTLAYAEDPKETSETQQKEAAQEAPAFEVKDLPKPEPIEGQLGEPGAPSLLESQEKLAKAMLEKGICNASFYGEDFCKKQESRTFRVTDQFGSSSVRVKDTSQE